MKLANIKEIGFEHIPDWVDSDYMDRNVILYSDVKDLPFKDDVLKTNMVVITVCRKGKIQLKVNDLELHGQQNDILVCLPNAYLKNTLISPDFESDVLCLSTRVITDFIPENRLWDKINMLSVCPIIHVDTANMQVFELYMQILRMKLQLPASPYKKEILYSLIKTCLFELLGSLNMNESVKTEFSRKEILFKNFIKLLSGVDIKPRTLSWYSERLFVSSKHLSTVCKEVSGKTAMAWVKEYVINDIKHLLLTSDKSIKEIADYYNFPNCSFFGKYVKEHTGYSPGEYRKTLVD